MEKIAMELKEAQEMMNGTETKIMGLVQSASEGLTMDAIHQKTGYHRSVISRAIRVLAAQKRIRIDFIPGKTVPKKLILPTPQTIDQDTAQIHG